MSIHSFNFKPLYCFGKGKFIKHIIFSVLDFYHLLVEVVGSTAWDEQQIVSNIVNILLKEQGKHKEFVETNTTFDLNYISTNCSQGSEDVSK